MICMGMSDKRDTKKERGSLDIRESWRLFLLAHYLIIAYISDIYAVSLLLQAILVEWVCFAPIRKYQGFDLIISQKIGSLIITRPEKFHQRTILNPKRITICFTQLARFDFFILFRHFNLFF